MKTGILQMFSQLGLTVQRSGKLYSCLCPLHGESGTPSLMIYPETHTWYCFGNACRRGGDCEQFLIDYLGFSFKEAREWLGYGTVKDDKPQFKIAKPRESISGYPIENIKYWHSLLYRNDRQKWFYDRGFNDQVINDQLWGWDGDRYVLPVWDWLPKKSNIIGARLRTVDPENPMKYIGIAGHNRPTVWGKQYCKNRKIALAFAGEYDAAYCALIDGFPAFSVVNGVNGYTRFIDDWQTKWFPDTEEILICWDPNEELAAANFAAAWNRIKGYGSATIIFWPYSLGKTDYNDFRKTHSVDDFIQILEQQIGRYQLEHIRPRTTAYGNAAA